MSVEILELIIENAVKSGSANIAELLENSTVHELAEQVSQNK